MRWMLKQVQHDNRRKTVILSRGSGFFVFLHKIVIFLRYDRRMKERDYIGFYLWEHEPCRIIEDDTTGRVIAEMYCQGRGFVPVLLTDIMWHGKHISESVFKEKVLRLTKRGRR